MTAPYTDTLHLTIVSDYICPWCYIGMSRVEQLEREYEVAVEWVPFELRPNTPPGGVPFDRLRGRGRYTEDYLLYIRDLAEAVGIDMKDRQFIPNSRPALEAAEWAQDRGCFAVLHRAFFRAYFEQGLDIGRLDVLRNVADREGVDGEAMAVALESGQYRGRLEEKLEWSRVAGGGGVPCYMFRGVDPQTGASKRFSFTGAQEYAVFAQVARRLGGRPREGGSP